MPERMIPCVSFDRMVSDNRCITLKKAGYSVTATTNVDEALDCRVVGGLMLSLFGIDFRRKKNMCWQSRPRRSRTRLFC
jgi:hypothetical protein